MLRWLTPLAVVLAVAAAGCGGGSSASESTTTTTETVAASTTTESTTSESTTSATTTEAAGGTTSGTFAWASKDCQSLIKAYAGLSAAVAAASTGQDVSGDVEKFSQYADKVPEQIRGDVKTLAAAYTTFASEMKKIGYTQGKTPTAAQLQQLQTASQALATSDVKAASTSLNAWTTKNCTK